MDPHVSQKPSSRDPIGSGAGGGSSSVLNNDILLGDYCTAQHLSRGASAQQAHGQPTTANIPGTALHRAGEFLSISRISSFCQIIISDSSPPVLIADYSDPTYLSSRTIDPSMLPMPVKRGVGVGAPRSGGQGPSQGHLRPPSATGGGGGYHLQVPPPPPLPPGARHPRQVTPQPVGIDRTSESPSGQRRGFGELL